MKVYSVVGITVALAVMSSLYLRERLAVGLACLVLISLGIYGIRRFATRAGYGDLHMTLALNIAVVFPVLIVATNFPLRVAFNFVERDMNDLADAIERGEAITLPKTIGIFTIYGAGARTGSQFFITSRSGHDWEVEGLVRDPDGDGYNTWSETGFSGGWSYMSED